MAKLPIPADYPELLERPKERIRTAQVRAGLAVNRELVLLYWQVDRDILDRQQKAGWGTKVIEQLSADLRKEFPGMKGFSARNLKYMRAYAEACWRSSVWQYPHTRFGETTGSRTHLSSSGS